MTSDRTKNMLSALVYSTLVTKLNERPLDELADVSCRIAEDIGDHFTVVCLEDCVIGSENRPTQWKGENYGIEGRKSITLA